MADVIAGRYVLLSSLGRGGMGEVFLADDLVLGRRVAIKRILAGSALDRVAIERLIREARLAATLHHPHVVAVHDLVTDGDRTHIVMEYVDSRSFAEMIRAKKTLEPDVVGRIGGQIASALEAAHRAGIIHRDVKPSNILVDDRQVAKLADFGVARSAGDPSLTGTGMMIGSVAFMAPEIAKGEDVTPAADIYSLGATMYAAIEGHAPFASEAESSSSMRMLARLITESAPYASHGGAFAGLIRRMMASDPTDRPTAGEVQRALAVLTAGPMPERQVVREESDGDATRITGATKPEASPTPTMPERPSEADGTADVLRGSPPTPATATPGMEAPNAALQRLVDAAKGAATPQEPDGTATALRNTPPTPTTATPRSDTPNAALQRLVDAAKRVTPPKDDSPTRLRNPAETLVLEPDLPSVPSAAPPADSRKKRLRLVAIGAVVVVVLAGTVTAIRWAGGISGVPAPSAGMAHTCALTQDGHVDCWGANHFGQLGDGTIEQRTKPVTVTGLTDVAALSAGGLHTCALTRDGLVHCWGLNDHGQLGDDTTDQSSLPGTVTSLTGVTALAAGAAHSCALTRDGLVHCWGMNSFGQLGDSTTGQRTRPVTVTGLTGATALSAGRWHTCALTQDGRVHCWGSNDSGQLGDATTTERTKPVTVSGLADATAVSAGGWHTCALTLDGRVRCWGSNYVGQLGDGTTNNRRTKPVTVTALADATGLSGGGGHTCALTQDGRMRCWGSNDFGQLGDRTTTDRSKPVTVTGLTDATAVSAGYDHTCALTQDGRTRCWGHNEYGQLGDGTTTRRTKPVKVTTVTG